MKKALVFLACACIGLSASFTAFAGESGKTDLVIAIDADVDTLHPSDFSTTVEMDVLNQIYDTLMYMNPDGQKSPSPGSQKAMKSAMTARSIPFI